MWFTTEKYKTTGVDISFWQEEENSQKQGKQFSRRISARIYF